MKRNSLITLALSAAATYAQAQLPKPPKWLNPPKAVAPGEAGSLQQAAETGDLKAQTRLGDLYFWGADNFKKDEKTAVIWYRRAAEAGYAEAQSDLGDCYLTGAGVKKDEREAVRWYEHAAAQGNAMAEYNLGSAYEEGRGLSRDPAKALNWYRRAADHELPVAQFYLGTLYMQADTATGDDRREAVALILKAANAGLPQAQLIMGAVYEKGLGVERDLAAAMDWYKKAAKQGYTEAKLRLGRALMEGEGIPEDDDAAAEMLGSITAEDGRAILLQADDALARLCRRARLRYGPVPEGAARDHFAAVSCEMRPEPTRFKKGKDGAAQPIAWRIAGRGLSPLEANDEKGLPAEQLRWGRELMRPGPLRDPLLAWAMLSLAVSRGDEKKLPGLKTALKQLAQLANELGPEKTNQAQKLADAWRARHVQP